MQEERSSENNIIKWPINTDLLHSINGHVAWKFRIFPFERENGSLNVLAETVYKNEEKYELELITNEKLNFTLISATVLEELLKKYYGTQNITGNNKTLFLDSKDAFTELIEEARVIRSSDIHIEAYETACRIRFRIDGVLVEKFNIRREDYPSLINRIKIQANLDIAEKRLPQDGRILLSNPKKLDIRVSVLPTLHGEKIVLRLLGGDVFALDLNHLGFYGRELPNYLESIRKPNGIVLISGPTGSGKTTTLYATLKLLNDSKKNIITIEDPIEYTLQGVNQVQLKSAIGLDFSKALRTFLRQDPDIIMVGEIRDPDTANMAIRAALTGHLVLSTVHTNSAWGIVSRLANMDIPTYLLAETINMALAQRLVRILCPLCKEQTTLDPSIYPPDFKPVQKLTSHYIAKGCEQCYQTGYKGRKAIYEVILMNRELATCIRTGATNVRELLRKQNVLSLADNAYRLFEQGETSITEIYSILSDNDA